jgi:hypothetical protein
MTKAKIGELITLKAKKVKVSDKGGFVGYRTEFYKDGELKATIPTNMRQPKIDAKTIILNGWKFAVEW